MIQIVKVIPTKKKYDSLPVLKLFQKILRNFIIIFLKMECHFGFTYFKLCVYKAQSITHWLSICVGFGRFLENYEKIT